MGTLIIDCVVDLLLFRKTSYSRRDTYTTAHTTGGGEELTNLHTHTHTHITHTHKHNTHTHTHTHIHTHPHTHTPY